jgi:hypothetical protein
VGPENVSMWSFRTSPSLIVFPYQQNIHYSNPQLIEGAVDNSGIRFFYTLQKREMDMGMMRVGDPALSLNREPVGNGVSQHNFLCPGSCSSAILKETVTVYMESFHMHQTGVSARNELIRFGEVVHLGQADYFDFDQQGSQIVQQEPFEVQPGDSWRMQCNYRSSNDTVFGRSSEQEMCTAFIAYYPRQTLHGVIPWICGVGLPTPLSMCEASHETVLLESEADLNRTFGAPATECNFQSFDDDKGSSGAHRSKKVFSIATAFFTLLCVVVTQVF